VQPVAAVIIGPPLPEEVFMQHLIRPLRRRSRNHDSRTTGIRWQHIASNRIGTANSSANSWRLSTAPRNAQPLRSPVAVVGHAVSFQQSSTHSATVRQYVRPKPFALTGRRIFGPLHCSLDRLAWRVPTSRPTST
jgi:hypothetical protein